MPPKIAIRVPELPPQPSLEERILTYQKMTHAEHMQRLGEIADRISEANRRLGEVIELLKDMAQGLA